MVWLRKKNHASFSVRLNCPHVSFTMEPQNFLCVSINTLHDVIKKEKIPPPNLSGEYDFICFFYCPVSEEYKKDTVICRCITDMPRRESSVEDLESKTQDPTLFFSYPEG